VAARVVMNEGEGGRGSPGSETGSFYTEAVGGGRGEVGDGEDRVSSRNLTSDSGHARMRGRVRWTRLVAANQDVVVKTPKVTGEASPASICGGDER
jgi:hypothetical protein